MRCVEWSSAEFAGDNAHVWPIDRAVASCVGARVLNEPDVEADDREGMILDLRTILEGWEYEPGKISVRKIIGQDGREKIQTRVDLGVLQFEVTGRPDGARPRGRETLLEWYEGKLREHVQTEGSEAGFAISADDCKELRHEAHLFYQRFLSNFVLEEFDAVEGDTTQNLRLLDFVKRYGEEEGDRDSLENQRAYVLMMNVRARVYSALQREQYALALAVLEDGIDEVRDVTSQDAMRAEADDVPEIQVLSALRDEVVQSLPENAEPRLQMELDAAVEAEDYERAAELRDLIRKQKEAEEEG